MIRADEVIICQNLTGTDTAAVAHDHGGDSLAMTIAHSHVFVRPAMDAQGRRLANYLDQRRREWLDSAPWRVQQQQ